MQNTQTSGANIERKHSEFERFSALTLERQSDRHTCNSRMRQLTHQQLCIAAVVWHNVRAGRVRVGQHLSI